MTVTPLTTVAFRDDPAAANQAGVPALVMRRDSDSVVVADGDLGLLHTDEAGRLKVATQPGSVTIAKGTLTTTAAAATGLTGNAVASVAGAFAIPTGRVSNLMLHVKNTGTAALAVGTFVWEGSLDSTTGADGTWFGLQAVRSNANTIELQIAPATLAVGAGYAAAWELSVNGLAWVRIRCSVSATASSAATWSILAGTYATEPIPAAQASATQAVSGSVTATPATPSTTTTLTTASTNATAVKASAGTLYGLVVSNPTATACYLRLYNKASGPTPATDSALVMATVLVPASSTVNPNLGALGLRFATGIAFTVTGAIADTDATNAVAGVRVLSAYL